MNKVDKIKNLLKIKRFEDYEIVDFIQYHSLQHFFYWKILNELSNEHEKSFSFLSEELKKIRKKNLLLFSEYKTIYYLSKENNLQMLLYKGLALSDQLYGDSFIRPSRDLDIFVDFNSISIADEILLKLGYDRVKPDYDLNYTQVKQIKNHIHHFSYYHKTKKVLIELHWQLFVPSSLMKNGEKLFMNIHYKEGILPHYKPEILLHYLIIHAAMHHWFKLIWLTDMDSMIRNIAINWDEFNSYQKMYKNDRMIHVSFKLLTDIFETPVPIHVRLNKVENKIYQMALESIIFKQNYLTYKGLKRVRRIYYLTLLKKSFRYKFLCWFAPMTSLDDWKTFPLPNQLYGLYYFFRPFLWFYHNYLKKK